MPNCTRFLLTVLLALTVAAPAARAADQLRMAWQTPDISAQYSYALANDAFKKAGLDVEQHTFPAGPAILPALAAGQIDLAWMGDFPAVTGFANGLPVSIIMLQNVATSNTRLAANPKSGIKTLADLKGKKIGVSLGSTSHGHILQALANVGLSQEDVTLVNLAPNSMPAAYLAGQIDAAVTWEPFIGEIEKAGAVRLATTQSLGLLAASVAVARTDYIRQHPDAIRKFLTVWDEANQAIRANPEQALAPEAQRRKMTVGAFLALTKSIGNSFPTLKEQLTPDYLGAPGAVSGGKLYAQLLSTAKLLVQLKRIPSVPTNLATLVDLQPATALVKGE